MLLAVGAAFGWLGPYGTYDFGLIARFAYWMIAIPLIGLLSIPVVRLVAWTELGGSWPLPARMVAGALAVAVPGTAVAIALQTIFGRALEMSAVELVRIYVSVAVVIAFVALPWRRVTAGRGQQPVEPASEVRPVESPAPAPATGSPFLRRIPAQLGTDLLFIATEDHYLRVTTDRGSDLILFRLSDAMAELDPKLGQQVHRSYWVAWRAVASVVRDRHRTILLLTNGARIPVSRPHARALRQSGWLGALPKRALSIDGGENADDVAAGSVRPLQKTSAAYRISPDARR
jgi:hypothetical protein